MSVLVFSLLMLDSYIAPAHSFPLIARQVKTADDGYVHGYVPEPSGRGTVGILVPCLVTLALCVCTALNLNIPLKSETRTERYLRYTKWILLGTFIPELVVLSAWKQWLSAKNMTTLMRKIFDEEHAQQKKVGAGADFAKVGRYFNMIFGSADGATGIYNRQSGRCRHGEDIVDIRS